MNQEAFKNKYKLLIYLCLIVIGCCMAWNTVHKILLWNEAWLPPNNMSVAYNGKEYSNLFMSVRQVWLDQFIQELRETGIYQRLSKFYDHNAAYYLYLSYMGNWLNLDSTQLFLMVQLIGIGSVITLFPALLYKISSSILLSIAGLLVFTQRGLSFFILSDSYWASAWVVFIGFPILFSLYCRPWTKWSVLWLTILVFAIGASNAVRGQASLGIWVAALWIVCYKALPAIKSCLKGQWKMIGAAFALPLAVFFSFTLFTQIVPSAYQSVQGLAAPLPPKGPWHSAYIGLGWEENPFGIKYEDACGYEACPDEIGSKENPVYIEAIREKYFETLAKDPAFFARSYFRKLLTATKVIWDASMMGAIYNKNGFVFFLLILFIAALIVFVFHYTQSRKAFLKEMSAWLFVLTLCFGAGVMQGMVAVPALHYMQGACAAIDVGTVILGNLLLAYMAQIIYYRRAISPGK